MATYLKWYTNVMIMFIHIAVALAGIITSSIGFFNPSLSKVMASYGLILATVASGAALVVVSSASLLHACLVGFVYTAAITGITAAAHSKVRKTSEVKVVNQ